MTLNVILTMPFDLYHPSAYSGKIKTSLGVEVFFIHLHLQTGSF